MGGDHLTILAFHLSSEIIKNTMSKAKEKALEEAEVTVALEKQAKDKHDKEKAVKKKEAQKQLDVSQNQLPPNKVEFKALIDAYAEKNPVKYERKKERLADKLASL